MSYAVRNTLILLVVLILFVAGGWGYIHYFQVEKIDTLGVQVEEKRQELQQKQQVANQYNAIAQTYQEASDYFNNYNKVLYRSSDEDKVFDFLTTLNRGAANNDFNFAFSDSTIHSEYGILNMEITGEGSYRNFVNFVQAIELSKPLNKVKNVSVTPIKVEDEYGRINYSFNLESYYDRSEILEEPALEVFTGAYASVYNPFFPLVRNVQPNSENMVNVEQSHLVALSTDRIFLVDQTGVMQQVRIGEEVYLGKLSSINLSNRSATFTLNKGGIVETVTLEVQNEN